MSARLPTHLEVSAIFRAVEAAGGYATVIARGESDAGVLLIVTLERGQDAQLWERMPAADGARKFTVTRADESDDPGEFAAYLDRRRCQDPDSWIVELDIVNPARFVETTVN